MKLKLLLLYSSHTTYKRIQMTEMPESLCETSMNTSNNQATLRRSAKAFLTSLLSPYHVGEGYPNPGVSSIMKSLWFALHSTSRASIVPIQFSSNVH